MSDKRNDPISWQDVPNAEERFQQLRDRDLELTNVALGLQMRTRITALEHEIAMFRKLEKTWKISKLRKAFLSVSGLIRRIVKRFG
jgi:hypothetical protein